MRQAIESGEVELVVGTHALVETRVSFRSLALAIVDEQHRFGVDQRQALFDKGALVDILVMTATPIPRSLALALYGDLDLSVIDEMPPGRTPVRDVVRGSTAVAKDLEFVGERIARGRAGVCRLPDHRGVGQDRPQADDRGDSKRSAPRSRTGGSRCSTEGWRLSEKPQRWTRSVRGEIDILVSTTVIEVGIDVAACVDHGDHRCRPVRPVATASATGRVGRGAAKSHCILVRDETATEEAKARLRVFESSSDGFASRRWISSSAARETSSVTGRQARLASVSVTFCATRN